ARSDALHGAESPAAQEGAPARRRRAPHGHAPSRHARQPPLRGVPAGGGPGRILLHREHARDAPPEDPGRALLSPRPGQPGGFRALAGAGAHRRAGPAGGRAARGREAVPGAGADPPPRGLARAAAHRDLLDRDPPAPESRAHGPLLDTGLHHPLHDPPWPLRNPKPEPLGSSSSSTGRRSSTGPTSPSSGIRSGTPGARSRAPCSAT